MAINAHLQNGITQTIIRPKLLCVAKNIRTIHITSVTSRYNYRQSFIKLMFKHF